MIIRWFYLLGGLGGIFILFNIINYWQIDNGGQRMLFGHQFSSEWGFRGVYALLLAPLIIFANVLTWHLYAKGYNDWFKHNIWQVQIISWAAGILVAVSINWAWYGQWPTKGTLVAIPAIVFFSLLSVFWK